MGGRERDKGRRRESLSCFLNNSYAAALMWRRPGPLAVPPISLCLSAAARAASSPSILHFGRLSPRFTSSFFLPHPTTSCHESSSSHFHPSSSRLPQSITCNSRALSPVALQTWRWGAGYGKGPGSPRDHGKGARPGPPGSTDPRHPSGSCFWKNAWKRRVIQRHCD